VTPRRSWLRGLPKAELHVHLEGTVRPETLCRIARRNDAGLPAKVEQLFRCSDFQSCRSTFKRVAKVLYQPQDFSDIAAEYLAASADQGVKHVEFFFSPATVRHFHPAADLAGIVEAIHAACQAARRATGISALLIFDMVRNLGEAAALADVRLAERCASWGVVGIGLGGDERNFPARDFLKPFQRAAAVGLRRTAHAGEAAGPQSVRDAVEILGAERIGHGLSAAADDALLGRIIERGIAIDCCLTSNEITGAVAGHSSHPLKDFMARGVCVTLNSDDPAFFGASLLDEYERAAGLGLTDAQLATLARNSFLKCFAPQSAAADWLVSVDGYLAGGTRASAGPPAQRDSR
jgi:adenosine deaminase